MDKRIKLKNIIQVIFNFIFPPHHTLSIAGVFAPLVERNGLSLGFRQEVNMILLPYLEPSRVY